MSDSESKSREVGGADLTTAIKQLSQPVDTLGDAFEEPGGTALLLCRDSDSKKWAPRWLGQSDLQVTIASDPANALELARATQPDVIIVDAALTDGGSQRIFDVLQDAADVRSKVIALCASNNEIKAALDARVFDIARKPYNWQSIAKRARHALQIKNRNLGLDEANVALQDALELANIARQRLRSQEQFEPVTGLPNKSKFVDLLRRAMQASERGGNSLAVFVVGFSRFRLVIEAMGQEQADRLLTEIGHKLGTCLSESSTAFDSNNSGLRTAAIGSLDSFRFGLMLTVFDDESVPSFQQQLLDVFSRPMQIMGQVVHLSASLGIAVYPQDADDVDQLLQRADNAMRDAQNRGGGVQYYCSETNRAAARKLKIEHMLHEALDHEELSLAYQPIIDVQTGATHSVEALLRWKQSDGSYIPPEEFITVAEETGLMLRLGEYVLEQACTQFASWRQSGSKLSHVCVNVAKAQLMSRNFIATVKRVLETAELRPGQLELEISERGVLSGDYEVVAQLTELKRLGVKLSIDDFGTGDSAIAYLKELPVDTLKIDRSYIAGFAKNGKDVAIASAMVALGQRLDLTVIAEGVETGDQLEVLREFGCNCYQGFLAAKALEPDAILDFLEENPSL
ncbi:MAG: GGDEF domain-containing response regulator [Gammaproteobacteria bacterium]|nr:GGDEF domain-containing response regulator [Gammaproteobacteria bacterium]